MATNTTMFAVFLVIILGNSQPTGVVALLSGDPPLSLWALSPDSKVDCSDHHLCTPHNLTYHHEGSTHFYSAELGCDLFARLNVSDLYFFGDSYLRHVAAAFHATLNDDHTLYTQESLKSSEEHRRNSLCNRTVQSHIFVRTMPDVRYMSKPNNSVVFISFGNHPTGHHRHGVNNATAQLGKFKPGCDTFRNAKKHFLFWVSTHARAVAKFPDENPSNVEQYNSEVREKISAGVCGGKEMHTQFIDVFNMTKSLLLEEPAESVSALTPDGVHWGKEVNMVKAQILMSEVEKFFL